MFPIEGQKSLMVPVLHVNNSQNKWKNNSKSYNKIIYYKYSLGHKWKCQKIFQPNMFKYFRKYADLPSFQALDEKMYITHFYFG